MDGYMVSKWERCKDLAKQLQVSIEISTCISLCDKHRLNLGAFETVSEVYAFLCGYEHKIKEVK